MQCNALVASSTAQRSKVGQLFLSLVWTSVVKAIAETNMQPRRLALKQHDCCSRTGRKTWWHTSRQADSNSSSVRVACMQERETVAACA